MNSDICYLLWFPSTSLVQIAVVSLANLHKRPEALARYYVTSYWQAEWVKELTSKTIELPYPPALTQDGGFNIADPRWQRSENTVITKLYDVIYHVIHFELTDFCVYYWLLDFYCRSLNPVKATEGGRNQVPGPRGPKMSVVQCSLARIFWDFSYVYL